MVFFVYHILSYSFGSIVYHCTYGYMFLMVCMLLFDFVSHVFLLSYLCILLDIFVYSYCYVCSVYSVSFFILCSLCVYLCTVLYCTVLYCTVLYCTVL
jgi:hypothetical protein